MVDKELLSALVAMDELMGSNEMNMQVSLHDIYLYLKPFKNGTHGY
jgi:hypothetical protein